MAGVFPGGGWAGHPDLVGRAAAVLEVTAVGRDPLRAAAHGGGSDRVSSGLLMGDERNARSLSVGFSALHFTAPPCMHYRIDNPASGFILPVASQTPSSVTGGPVHEPTPGECRASAPNQARPAAQISASSFDVAMSSAVLLLTPARQVNTMLSACWGISPPYFSLNSSGPSWRAVFTCPTVKSKKHRQKLLQLLVTHVLARWRRAERAELRPCD
ncbi:hypothetical protein EYF80_032064 [Liparis tanakae]|uniref:Uncharacterized protein n=1 Tax=Liparis tanakae TaxID=230148 RepID=A0A4Z2GX59_9TELE|nr:hypothetical protein EYF80_032064 [Liparis tanakae]